MPLYPVMIEGEDAERGVPKRYPPAERSFGEAMIEKEYAGEAPKVYEGTKRPALSVGKNTALLLFGRGYTLGC